MIQTVEAWDLIPCVYACMCVCLSSPTMHLWRPEVNIKCLHLSFSTLFLRPGLFLALALAFLARLASQWDPDFLWCPYSPALRLWMPQYRILVGAGDPNLGLDSCTASSLPVLPSPHPLYYGTFLDSVSVISAEVVVLCICVWWCSPAYLWSSLDSKLFKDEVILAHETKCWVMDRLAKGGRICRVNSSRLQLQSPELNFLLHAFLIRNLDAGV